ncbi:MAG: hypothetical protein JSV54_02365 [Chloroflexota bacterium]|nr:MAG: hypothetical protein JSV54_02365 [Chloroflexota bacterium]
MFETFSEIISTATSRYRLKQLISLPLYSNAFFLMADTAVTSLGGFLFWIVVARFYSEAEVGYGSAIISAVNFLLLLSLVGLNFSIIRFLSEAKKPNEFINSSFTIGGFISIAIAAIFVAGIDFWSPALGFIKTNPVFAVAFVGVTAITTVSVLVYSVFVAKRRAGFELLKSAIFSAIKIPLPLAFVLFLHTFGVIASWGIALAISLFVSLFVLLPRVENRYKPVPTLKWGYIRDTWQYSGSSYLASVLALTPRMILPLMVLNILGRESNAYFYVALMIGNLLFAIPQSFSRSLFAEGSYSQENIKQNVTRALKLVYLLTIPALILIVAAGKWLLLAFGASYSINGLVLLWLFSCSSLPLGIILVYTSILRVRDKLAELIVIQGFSAVAILGLSYLAMPAFDILGVGIVWLGVQVVIGTILAIRLSIWMKHKDSDAC